jgi:hypothetical protein
MEFSQTHDRGSVLFQSIKQADAARGERCQAMRGAGRIDRNLIDQATDRLVLASLNRIEDCSPLANVSRRRRHEPN